MYDKQPFAIKLSEIIEELETERIEVISDLEDDCTEEEVYVLSNRLVELDNELRNLNEELEEVNFWL